MIHAEVPLSRTSIRTGGDKPLPSEFGVPVWLRHAQDAARDRRRVEGSFNIGGIDPNYVSLNVPIAGQLDQVDTPELHRSRYRWSRKLTSISDYCPVMARLEELTPGARLRGVLKACIFEARSVRSDRVTSAAALRGLVVHKLRCLRTGLTAPAGARCLANRRTT